MGEVGSTETIFFCCVCFNMEEEISANFIVIVSFEAIQKQFCFSKNPFPAQFEFFYFSRVKFECGDGGSSNEHNNNNKRRSAFDVFFFVAFGIRLKTGNTHTHNKKFCACVRVSV